MNGNSTNSSALREEPAQVSSLNALWISGGKFGLRLIFNEYSSICHLLLINKNLCIDKRSTHPILVKICGIFIDMHKISSSLISHELNSFSIMIE